jgi:hypothetical protein
MKPTRTFSISLNLNWRVLVATVCIVAVLVLAFITISAQGNSEPSTNDPEAQAANVQAPAAPAPAQPAPDCGGKLPTINGECIAPEAVGTVSRSAQGGGGVAAQGGGIRHVYLTDLNYHTDEALWACGAGYHMASLWEILDTTTWVYDYDHPEAHVMADSGYGPPSYWNGWARTGYSSSNSSTTGTGNCWAWTSRLSADYGVSVRLSRTWETAPGDIATWDATSFDCSYTGPVWCVKD